MNYLLILQFPITESFGLDQMVELEEMLEALLEDSDDVDGHDIGVDEMNIFIFTTAPRIALNRVFRIHDLKALPGFAAAYRAVDEELYTRLYPEGCDVPFTVR